MPAIYDLVIIGAGPAGMTAALYASRHGLSYLVIAKQVGGAANLAPMVGSYPGFPNTAGYDLMAAFKKNLDKAGVTIHEAEVRAIRKKGKIFAVKTGKEVHEARSVIIATGRRDKKLGVKGEEKFLGKGLSYCTVCDGPVFRGKTVAIVGGGRTGIFATLFMLKLAKKIYIIEKAGRLGGPELTREIEKYRDIVAKAPNVEVLTGTQVTEIVGDKLVTSLKLRRKGKASSLPVDGVFIEIGYTPNTDFVKGLVRLNRRGEIDVDENCRTSVPGIYAAGDVTDVIGKQIVVACGEGANALIQVSAYVAGKGKKN